MRRKGVAGEQAWSGRGPTTTVVGSYHTCRRGHAPGRRFVRTGNREITHRGHQSRWGCGTPWTRSNSLGLVGHQPRSAAAYRDDRTAQAGGPCHSIRRAAPAPALLAPGRSPAKRTKKPRPSNVERRGEIAFSVETSNARKSRRPTGGHDRPSDSTAPHPPERVCGRSPLRSAQRRAIHMPRTRQSECAGGARYGAIKGERSACPAPARASVQAEPATERSKESDPHAPHPARASVRAEPATCLLYTSPSPRD